VSVPDLWMGLAGLMAPSRELNARRTELAEYLGVRHLFLVSSGTAALTLVLRALATRSRRTEVVVPAYTCFSVPAAVIAAGLTPALCDVNPATLDFDYPLLERVVTTRTLCVLTQHPFGIVSNVARVRSICASRGAIVVEDAAQAMGMQSSRGTVGALGHVGIYSLGRGKGITCGSGGIVVTNVDGVAAAITRSWQTLDHPGVLDAVTQLAMLLVLSVFVDPRLYWIPASLPFLRLGETIFPTNIAVKKLSGLQAGSLRHWRARLDRANRLRRETVAYYDRHLNLTGRPTFPHCRLPIIVSSRNERDRLHQLSKQHGLGLGVGYPSPVSEIPELKERFEGQRFPGAERIVSCLVTLPTHHHVSDRDKEALVECLASSPGVRRPSLEGRKAS
jgi:dTDP-4-amino-4,6-dideoxygalactose transaminase